MKKNIKTIIGLLIAFIIGISTTVGATTVFNSKDITYSSSATTKTNVKDSLDELYTKASQVGQCPEGKICLNYMPIQEVKIGDYISMIPENDFFDTDITTTGFSTSQHFWTQDLRLWRVIRKNEDGTIDAVSEYVSDYEVYFNGKTGFLNFVGVLNEIAAQYTNTKYISKTRHMGGYTNQVEKCSSLSNCQSDDSDDSLTDIQLVANLYGSLLATHTDGTQAKYWVATRKIQDEKISYGLAFDTSGNWSSGVLIRYDREYAESRSVRPILTFKANVQIISGDGKSADTAYQLA